MIDNEGNLVSDPKITMNNFQLYFENLLNIQTHHEIDNANGIWEQDEGQMYATVEPEVPERRTYFGRIKAIVESLKNNKAPGEDNINAELFKLVGKTYIKSLQLYGREKNLRRIGTPLLFVQSTKKGILRK